MDKASKHRKQNKQTKISKWDYIKLNNLCTGKETPTAKGQPTEGGKELPPRVDEEPQKLNSK